MSLRFCPCVPESTVSVTSPEFQNLLPSTMPTPGKMTALFALDMVSQKVLA